MSMDFWGYIRENGKVGARNHVAVIPTVVCASEAAQAISNAVPGCIAFLHHQGCCQLPPDLERVTDALIALGSSPNVGAVLIVSLGCEGTDVERLCAAIEKTGKPMDMVRIQEDGGVTDSIALGISKAQKLSAVISAQRREKARLSDIIMSIKCGGSDATSGMASNCVIGYVADKIVDLGGTVIFGETTEFIGAEHILANRAVTKEVGDRIFEIVDNMEKRAKSLGCDMRKGQPTPGNIAGGLTTIEEKSLGAIMKSGSRPIQGVMDYTDMVSFHKGLWIKDTPGREPEILTGMACTGAQAMLFSTGRGAPQGFPSMPVIKICGNVNTFEKMRNDMDMNAGLILTGEKSIDEIGELAFQKLISTLNGELTKSEAIKYYNFIDIHTLGPVI